MFTTGTNAGGYTLTSIEFSFHNSRTSTNTFVPTVKLHNVTVSGSSVMLGTAVATLTTSSTFVSNSEVADETYTAPPDTTLAPSTTYGVFAEGGPTRTFWGQLDTGDEDGTPAAGWSIGDQVATRAHDATAGFTVGTDGPGQIRVNGTAKSGTAPTGAPTITGTAQVGQTLTAVTTAIMDGDGLTTPGYTYQWIRVATDNTETNIAMATASTYTLVTDDLGTTIKVKVSFTDDASNAETLTSVATAAVAAATIAVPTNWSLTPTGLSTGDKFRLLFLSSTKRDGSSSDIADYHAFIQTRAAAGHADIRTYSTGFRAVGCTADTDARDTTETTYTSTDKGVPIYWLNGDKAADQYEDFYDGTWDDEVNDKNESGTNGPNTSLEANYPLTGCNDRGTEYFDRFNRSSALAKIEVMVGRPNSSAAASHGPLSSNTALDVSNTVTRPMYGLSAIFQVAADTTPPTLTSADVEIADALIINLVFSEDLQLSNPPALSAFTVTVDGSAATVSSVLVPGSVLPQNELRLQLSTAIRQRQAVVVTYTDATSGDDTAAIQDTAGNDAATFTTGMDGVPAVTNNSTVTNTVPADWSLIPTGLSTGDKFRLLFLSSTKRNASSTDIADYNTFIQTRAAAGHTDIRDYSADFRAVGCTAAVDARDNTKTTYTTTDKGVPIYWLNGAKAADQYEDFYDGSWDDEANDKNEFGTNGLDTSQNVNYPWTGCDHDGTEAVTGGDSFALGTGLVDARVGRPNSSGSNVGPLNGQTNRSDFQNSPLYGLSEVFQVAAAVVVPNNPPAFSADTAARSVAENTAAGQNVGAALTATDADSDTLTYTLEGTDAASFDIISGSGQIRTRTGVTYNHEAKSTHTVVVKADDGNGGTDTIAVTIAVTDVDEPPGQPAAPTVSATAGSTTSLDVTWTAPTNTGPAIASYDLQYRAGTSGNFTDGPKNVTGTSAAIGSLAADTSYEVQVRATNAEGDGDWSVAGTGRTTATSAPGAPTGLSATASGTTAINLSWSAPGSTGGSAITGYKIEVSPNGTSGWTDQVANTNSTATTYAHTGLTAGDTRHYRVSAINTNGTGTASNVDSATTATSVPGAPTSLAATSSGTTAINLSWSAPASTGGSAITGYKIEVSPNGTSGWTDQVANTNSTATTYAHTGLGGGTTRHYRVSAINTNGTGTASNVANATTDATVPGAPTGLTATASGSTAINLSWSAPASTGGSAITGYKIEVSPNGTSGWTDQVANTNSTATTYAHTGLTAGDTRHYRVSAINANGTGTASNVDSATTGTSVPGAPTSLAATSSGSTAINLSWSAPASTGGSAITGYKIEVSPNGTSGWTDQVANTNSTATTYAHTGLGGGTTRHYRVSAINTNGTGTASNVANATTDATVPGAPTGLTATASGSTAINLSWAAPASTGGSAITGYKIEVSPNGTSGWTDQVANTNSTATTYAHTGLTAGDTRHYRVSAINANGTGTASNVDSATTGTSVPGAPTSLAATSSGSTAINLSWSAPASTGGSAITGYKIEVSPNGTSGWTDQVANTNSTATTYAHTGLGGGTTRHYRVSAINTNGTGTASNVANATTDATVPGAPTGLTATASGSTAINLSWAAPASTGGSAITGYKIEVSPNGTSGWTDQVANTNSTATTYAHTGLTAGDTRHYRVSAINTNGTGTASNVDSATTATSVPGAPTSLAATSSGTTAINLSWSAPASTGGSAITGYKIEVSPNGTSGWTDQVANTNSTATTYAHTGLGGGTTRHYRVSAINTNGTGTASNVANATTDATVPGAPTGLTATASGSTAINLSWSAPASTGGSAITGYKIEVSPNGTSGWTDQVANTNSTATTYAHTGLTAGDTRHYRVSAINANGTGTASNVDSATTGTSVPGAPTSLAATSSGSTAINLSWSAPASTGGSAITGYKIEVSPNGTSGWTDQVANTNSTATTYAHTGLGGGTTRHYRVSAINTNGTGTASNVANATTGATAPGAPTGLTATASGTTAINLSWSAPGSTGGSAITGYRIEVSSNGTSSWTNLVANTNSTATTYAHTGLTAGTTRHYRVSAINTNGTGTASNVANATTGQTTVTFGASSYTAAEGGATATVAVVLSAPASASVTIPLTKAHRGGATAADYSGVPSNVTFTAGQTRRTFTVTATDDADKDGGESVQLGFGTLPGGYAPGARRTATVTLVDDDANLIVNFGTERHTTVKVRESDTVWHRFTFSLSTSRYGPPNGNPQQPVTIPLVVTHRGGATTADYEVRGRGALTSVTFGVGESVTDFFMRAIPDGRRETGEGLRLDFGRLPAGVRAGTWGPYETIEFLDEYLPDLTVRFGEEAYTATEGGAAARVSIHLSEEVEVEPLVVQLSAQPGGGATSRDYSVPLSVTFAVGERTRTIEVVAVEDTDDDDGESVSLSFVNAPNDRLITGNGPSTATVALEDNDGAGRVEVSFAAATYTATEGGSGATVRVELDKAPGRSVTVPLAVTQLGGASPADYSGIPSIVAFGPNETSMTITVTATDDTDPDGGESVRIGFGELPDGVLAGRPAAAVVTLADGTEQTFIVNFGTDTHFRVQARESNVGKWISVYLGTDPWGSVWNAKPGRPVTIPLVVTYLGGATGADHTAIPASVTFAVGSGRAGFNLRAIPDGESESGEGLRIDFGELPPGVTKGSWGYETIEFVDADAAALSVSGPLLTLSYPGALDGGSTPSGADFVVLAGPPGGEAMVPVTSVWVDGNQVLLALERPVAARDTVTLTYLMDAMHPIRDAKGLRAAPLADEPVRNVTGIPPEQAAVLDRVQSGARPGRLDLSSRNLTDLSALAGLSGVRELDLRDNAITDLSPLSDLSELQVLDLSGNRIKELWPLAGLPALQRLNLSDNRIADIATLSGLTGLEVLDLSGNRIEELWPLAGLPELERLNLSGNRITDIDMLSGLSGLEVLLLDRNRVADVEALSPLTGLANLGLSENGVEDIGLLANLGRLRRLDLSGNAVADVTALGDVSELLWLRLPGNPVSDVAPLGRLEMLRWLWLDSGTTAGMEALALSRGRGAAPLWIERVPAK